MKKAQLVIIAFSHIEEYLGSKGLKEAFSKEIQMRKVSTKWKWLIYFSPKQRKYICNIWQGLSASIKITNPYSFVQKGILALYDNKLRIIADMALNISWVIIKSFQIDKSIFRHIKTDGLSGCFDYYYKRHFKCKSSKAGL